VQRRAGATSVIQVCGQKISLGRLHAGQIVTIETLFSIELAGDDIRTVRRTTTTPVRNIKADRPTRKAGRVS
jgi:hypothetical protein